MLGQRRHNGRERGLRRSAVRTERADVRGLPSRCCGLGQAQREDELIARWGHRCGGRRHGRRRQQYIQSALGGGQGAANALRRQRKACAAGMPARSQKACAAIPKRQHHAVVAVTARRKCQLRALLQAARRVGDASRRPGVSRSHASTPLDQCLLRLSSIFTAVAIRRAAVGPCAFQRGPALGYEVLRPGRPRTLRKLWITSNNSIFRHCWREGMPDRPRRRKGACKPLLVALSNCALSSHAMNGILTKGGK
jgi:hypothetical protein